MSFILIFCVALQLVDAQVFSNSVVDVNFTGLSLPCLNSLNGSITCDDSLPTAIWDPSVYLDNDQLTSLCNSTCSTSLQCYRNSVVSACTSSDIIVIGGLAYPASYRPDEYIFNYNILCRKDASSGLFCATVFDSWTNLTVETTSESCSDCALGVQQLELNSTFGYLSEIAVEFSSTTKSCGSTGYAYTSPTPVALNGTATSSTATATPCADTYTILAGDNCNTIAKAQNVSTFSLLYENNLEAYCADFPAVGTSICLPGQCNVYTVAVNDTCRSIIASVPGDITLTQLSSWNPNINIGCGNLGQLVDTEICISPVGGLPPATLPAQTTGITTVAPVPTTIANGTNTNCGKYYLVLPGDECAALSVQQGVALADFYFLNPGINANCTNLIAGESYCLEAVGDIATYTSYGGGSGGNPCLQTAAPSSCFSDLGSFPTAAYWSAGATVIGNTTISAIDPIATGTSATCYEYQEYISLNSTNTTVLAIEASINSCAWIAGSNEIDLDDFLSWNPSLASQNSTDCTLIEGYRYCVALDSPSITTVSATTTNNPLVVPTATNAPSGTVSNCNAFALIYGGDVGNYTCSDLLAINKLSLAQLYALNPWVKSDCSGLYANLSLSAYRSVCVGASTVTASSTSSPPAPTQTGIISSCLEFYTATADDSCQTIETAFDITFAQFFSWNPAVGSNCGFFIIGDSYCVSAPSSTTTTTSTSTSSTAVTAPTQPGIVSSCTEYYITQSGDGCDTIESKFSISFAQFYAWNPAVGSNCGSLWLDETYCVAAPSQPGISTACTQYYVTKSGDGCDTIESAFGITFAQFYEWNPAVGSNCESLWLDETYCVAAPTTTTTTSVTPPGPTQTGIIGTCNAYTVLASGGSCDAIESQFGITFAQFFAWNPAVGSNCQNLWVDEAYCVGVSS